MNPKWLIEDFTQDSWYRDLIKEVKKQGMECIVLDITNHFDLKPGLIKNRETDLGFPIPDFVIFQGSIQLFRKLKKELPAYPLGWMTDPSYLCSRYYPHFQKYLFNDRHVFTTVANLIHNKFWFYGQFGKEAVIYVRPDGGDKAFAGRLLDLQEFDKFWENDVLSNCQKDSMLMVSTPKNIRGEWRYICTYKKEIIGTSLYRYQDQQTYIPSAPEKATALCNTILELGWYPDPVFTIDICEDMDGNYWLLEINSFTSAGTYAADKSKIVSKVTEIATEQYNELLEKARKLRK